MIIGLNQAGQEVDQGQSAAAAAGTDYAWYVSQSGSTAAVVADLAQNVAPVAVAPDRTVQRNQRIAAATLFTVSDANNDPITQYQFWDETAGNGSFFIGGLQQATDVALNVSAAQLGQTEFRTTGAGGTDVLWVRAFDGTAWGAWDRFVVTAPANRTPVADAPDRSLGRNQTYAASSLFTVSDADGDAITQYQFWDETAGNGAFFVGEVQQATGVAINVSATQLAQTDFRTGGAGSSDVLWVRAFDGTGWGAWDRFVVAAPPNRTPVADAPDRSLGRNQTYAASSLFTVSDADGDAITQYQFWDETAGNGAFFVGGVQQATGVAINVAASQLSQTDFRTTNAGGSDVLWVRAFDGTGWGAWDRFVVTAPPNRAPVADAPDRTLVRNQSFAASSLFTASDADGDAITQYQFWDDTAGSGAFFVGGVQQATGVAINVAASQLSQTDFRTGSAGGTDVLWVRASDGAAWGAWDRFVVTTPPNRAPVATGFDRSVTRGQSIAAGAMFTVSDADGDAIAQYQFWDETGGNGAFYIGGVRQVEDSAISVSAAQLSQTTFRAGDFGGSDVLWVRASDGTSWSAWSRFNANGPVNNAPVVSASNRSLAANQTVAASSLFSASDADGDAITRYQLWDETAGNGSFFINGVRQATGVAIDVSPSQLAQTSFTAGATGTDVLWVRAGDGGAWGQWKRFEVAGPQPDLFNIDIDYSGDSRFLSAFTAAAQRWQQVITAGLPDYAGVDDLRISASVIAIDGQFGILGRAGPTAFRPTTTLPYRGIMEFDSADVEYMYNTGTLTGVIMHEMGHVLGLGTLWDYFGLKSGNSYFGANALREYRNMAGNQGLSFVPLETQGGQGTAGSHWLESLFGNELMTGYAESGFMPLSRLTVGGLADLGYTVNYGAADAFSLPATGTGYLVASEAVSQGNYLLAGDTWVNSIDIGTMSLADGTLAADGGSGLGRHTLWGRPASGIGIDSRA